MGTVTKKLRQRKIFLFLDPRFFSFFFSFSFHLPFPPFPASRGRCRDYQIAPQGNWNIHSLEVNRDPWFRERFWVMRSPILKYFECKAISRGCPSPYTPAFPPPATPLLLLLLLFFFLSSHPYRRIRRFLSSRKPFRRRELLESVLKRFSFDRIRDRGRRFESFRGVRY